MNILDAYGDFDVPEEKSVVEVVEDPVKIVLASYDLFKKISKNEIKNNGYKNESDIEPVYLQGLKVFVEKTELKPDAEQLEEIINELRKKAEKLDGTGVFLSALINTTKISMLFVDEFPKLDQIGYRLKKNKTIILGPKNISFELGLFAEGNTINQGTTTHQGYNASGGNHINQGTTTHQGYNASGGNHINQGTIQHDQGLYASGGNHINQGTTHDQGWSASGGNHINQGTIRHDQGWGASGGNHINQGTTHDQGWGASGGNHINIKTVKAGKGKLVIDLSQKQHPLKSQLEQKLDELEFLHEKETEKLIQIVNTYDWKKFDKEINEICGEIKEEHSKNL